MSKSNNNVSVADESSKNTDYDRVSVHTVDENEGSFEDEPEANNYTTKNMPIKVNQKATPPVNQKLSSSVMVRDETKHADQTPISEGSLKLTFKEMLGGSLPTHKVKFCYMQQPTDVEDGVDVTILFSSVKEATARYNHTLYGYFLSKRIAYPKGLKGVLENGPWVIQLIPIILNKWTPNISLTKEDLIKLPVWVKILDVSLARYIGDELSSIASKIVNANEELKESLTVATPNLEGNGVTRDEVHIEYEWKPPRCGGCKVFGHKDAQCRKAIPVPNVVVEINDRFKEVYRKMGKGGTKNNKDTGEGFKVGKQPKFVYRPVKVPTKSMEINKNQAGMSGIGETSNPFGILTDLNEGQEKNHGKGVDYGLIDEATDVEEDQDVGILNVNTEGASTPGHENLMFLSISLVGFVIRCLWGGIGLQITACVIRDGFVGNHPWTILGDFNASLFVDESTSGSSRMTITMREFKECLDEIQVTDLNYSGINFTWNQSPLDTHGMLKKIDRVLVNEAFLTDYPNAYTIFQPYRISDHSPAVLKIPSIVNMRPKMFQFNNYIAENEKFRTCDADVWKEQIGGHSIYTIVKRLLLLKKPLWK
ncbi:uncharacterized protein [Rutidosis leptorrhynchoides]|uniref:uncharacterized protein n=1 Tax=Rutidosis leptorrhynchoides TaxID=125765 RepID=UPI003A9A2E4D